MRYEIGDFKGASLCQLIRQRQRARKAGQYDIAREAQADIDQLLAKATGSVPTPRPASTGDFQLRRLIMKARNRNHSLLVMRHFGMSELAWRARCERDEAMQEARARRDQLTVRRIS